MVLMPGLRLGVVVLINANNGAIPLALGKEIFLASGIVRLLLGIPAPRRRLSFRGFYALLDATLAVLSLYQVWSLVRLMHSSRRSCSALGLASLVEVVLEVVAAVRIP